MQWGIQRKASAAWARFFFPCEQKTGRTAIEEIKHIAPRASHARRRRAAFKNGSVVAWVIWHPFLAVQRQSGARILLDGGKIASF